MGKENKSQFLLSFTEPHRTAVNYTISCWTEKVRKEYGVNTAIFKGHSVGSASSSKAGLLWFSVSVNLKRYSFQKI